MKLQFLYSKNREREKLADIYLEYQWFIDNDFSIALPKFYSRIYKQNKTFKKLFIGELNKELSKIYKIDIYKKRKGLIKNNWQKIEKDFFKVLEDLNLKIRSKYFCYISLYGPQGQFKYPNEINLRVNTKKDIIQANQTIAHEIIHLMIFNRAKKLKLNYEQVEGSVDLFFIKTKLKDIFTNYKVQSMGDCDDRIFKKLFERESF